MKICWTGNSVGGIIMLTFVPLGARSDHLHERRTATGGSTTQHHIGYFFSGRVSLKS